MSTPKLIKITYFASLREQAGTGEESVATSALTYQDLYLELSQKYYFSLPVEMVQVAVNDEFSSLQDRIKDGAKIVFIPPVAGG